MCTCQGEPRTQTLTPAAKGVGEENLSDFYPEEHMRRLSKRDLLPEDLTDVESDALMFLVDVFALF